MCDGGALSVWPPVRVLYADAAGAGPGAPPRRSADRHRPCVDSNPIRRATLKTGLLRTRPSGDSRSVSPEESLLHGSPDRAWARRCADARLSEAMRESEGLPMTVRPSSVSRSSSGFNRRAWRRAGARSWRGGPPRSGPGIAPRVVVSPWPTAARRARAERTRGRRRLRRRFDRAARSRPRCRARSALSGPSRSRCCGPGAGNSRRR